MLAKDLCDLGVRLGHPLDRRGNLGLGWRLWWRHQLVHLRRQVAQRGVLGEHLYVERFEVRVRARIGVATRRACRHVIA